MESVRVFSFVAQFGKIVPTIDDVLHQVGLNSRLPLLGDEFPTSCRKLQKSEKIGFGKRPTIFSTLGRWRDVVWQLRVWR